MGFRKTVSVLLKNIKLFYNQTKIPFNFLQYSHLEPISFLPLSLGGSIPSHGCILPPTHSCVGPTADGSHQL